MNKKKNIRMSWFTSASRCSYSGLGITHPTTIACSDPGSSFYADIAKLGNNILLVKPYGYVSSSAESEFQAFIDDFLSRYFDSEKRFFYIEDYTGITGGDAESRKKYISYFKNNEFLIAAILYNLPSIYKISFNLFKKLSIYSSRAHAVNTYEQAIDLAKRIIDQGSDSHISDDNQSVGVPGNENRLPEAVRSGIFGFFPRFFTRLKAVDLFFTQKARQNLAQKYSEELIKYIAAIDWRTPGIHPAGNLLYDDVSSKKVFDAISFVKSEIDSLMEERDTAEAVLKESEARYRLLLKHAKAGFLEYDYVTDRIISVNDEFIQMTGYPEHELLGMAPIKLLTPERQILFRNRLNQLQSGEPISQDIVYQGFTKNNDIRWWLLNSNVIFEKNRPVGANVVLTDITKLKHTEKQLLEYQEKLKRLSIRLSMIEEDQRRSMASHLHETIGQELFVLQLQLNTFEKFIDNPELLSSLTKIKKQLLKIIKETKSLTFDLSPPVLYDFGFEEALKTLAEMIESKHDIHVETCFEGEMDAFEDEIKVILYRNVKELLHNSVKHAVAENITMRLKGSPSGLNVELRDDGVGFDADHYINDTAAHEGFGLFDIREKLNHLGGNLIIDSKPGQGTSICMRVPLDLKN